MFKASELVEFCKSMIGQPYWYGTCVYNCTESTLQRKAKQYPAHYTSSRMSKYRDAISKKKVCMDCVGMIKGFFWTNGGVGVKEAIGTGKSISNQYASNGCPDRSADGMLSWCKNQGCKNGAIATLPEVPGVLLFSSGHVGVYIGDGYAVEARGFNYGVVKTKVSSRSWTSWAYLPSSLLDYGNTTSSSSETVTKKEYKLGDRLLKKGMEGDDVKELQTNLIKLGYSCGNCGADGDFGSGTQSAVKAFQKDNGLSVDGQYGTKSHAAMIAALEKISNPGAANNKTVTITGGSVNIRKGPGTSYGIFKVAHKGDVFECTGKESNGWIPIKIDGGDYWVSAKYAE